MSTMPTCIVSEVTLFTNGHWRISKLQRYIQLLLPCERTSIALMHLLSGAKPLPKYEPQHILSTLPHPLLQLLLPLLPVPPVLGPNPT